MRVIVVWQGGGALGAYAAGVWRELAPRLQARGARLVGLAGASIGAINAAVIARHHADADWGVAALDAFWRERLATPSWPFTGALAWLPPWSELARSWDGLLTGVLIGNRGLYQALPLNWNPLAGLQRLHRPLLDRSRMLATLQQAVGNLGGDAGAPWLGVAATDVLSGELHVFGTDEGEVTPRHLAASAAIPLLFEPVEIDGRPLWDGDMIRRSLLPRVIERVAAREAPSSTDDPLVCISVELMPREAPHAPLSGAAIMARVAQLQQAGKLHADEAPAPVPAGWRVLHLARSALPNDGVSNQFDYSPHRVDQLISQGRQEARQAWQQWMGEPVDRQLAVEAQAEPARAAGPHARPVAASAPREEPAPADPVAQAVREVLGEQAPGRPLTPPEIGGTVH
ncbi:MAG: patatin-like phospholipase family protein [Pseudomonadota bacterium]